MKKMGFHCHQCGNLKECYNKLYRIFRLLIKGLWMWCFLGGIIGVMVRVVIGIMLIVIVRI